MSKASGGVRKVTANNAANNRTYNTNPIQLVKSGKYDSEDTDDVRDFYLPKDVVSKLDSIEKIDTYEKARDYLAKYGIELVSEKDTDSKGFKKVGLDISRKFIVGVETYRSVFGKNALSKLKKIVLFHENEPTAGAYYFNSIGEKDPKAGSIYVKHRFEARSAFHELAHAFQDSHAKKGEDAITYSNRVVQKAQLDHNAVTYFNANSKAKQAERFADAFANAFAYNKKNGVDFINNIRKKRLY